MRRNIGVAILAASALYSTADLAGWLRPMLLRLRIHDGTRRAIGIAMGSLTLKTVILVIGIALAFWPERPGASRT
jgi:hypothetical protein